MEGHKPEKNKNPWAEGMKAASIAAGLSTLPMVDSPAEAQNQKIFPIEEFVKAWVLLLKHIFKNLIILSRVRNTQATTDV